MRTTSIGKCAKCGQPVADGEGVETQNGGAKSVIHKSCSNPELKCSYCGYQWKYKGSKQFATCPNCYLKVKRFSRSREASNAKAGNAAPSSAPVQPKRNSISVGGVLG